MGKEIQKNNSRSMVSGNVSEVKGMENFSAEKIVIPAIKLVQPISVEAVDGTTTPGKMINSVTKEILPDEIIIIPISFKWTRIRFDQIGSDKPILCRSFNGKEGVGEPAGVCKNCQYAEWENDEPPECSENFEVACIIETEEDWSTPIVARFSRSSAKAGVQLYNTIAMFGMKGLSPWLNKYKLSTKFMDTDKGKYYVFQIRLAGKPEEDSIQYAESIYEMLAVTGYESAVDENEIHQEQENIEKMKNQKVEV